VAVVGLGSALVFQQQSQNRLSETNEQLRQQIGALATDNESLSNRLGRTSTSLPDDQKLELLHLRGEVGLLKRQLAEAAQSLGRASARARDERAAGARAESADTDQQRSASIAKMNNAKQLMLAFMNYAEKNQGRIPATIGEAAAFLGNPGDAELAGMTNMFEICYQGTVAGITNPGATIVLKEAAAAQGPDGQWAKTYGFGDGHAEIHVAADGNFQEYEAQHAGAPAGAPVANP
jgi:hypothetical protein